MFILLIEPCLHLIISTHSINLICGASRKRIAKRITGERVTGKNLGGNLGIAVWCALNGASIVRVHDVQETVQALKVVEALSSGELDRLSLKND